MKFFIYVPDGMVAIDGRQISDLSMSSVPAGVVRVSWHGTYGDEHVLDGAAITVRRFFDLAPYATILEMAQAAIAAADSAAANIATPTYAYLRSLEYPDHREYLDGVVKGDQAQIDAYIAACKAVKDKYPKPSGV
jgi:hypothetical protein